MTWNRVAYALLTAVALTGMPGWPKRPTTTTCTSPRQVRAKGVEWYSDYLGCTPLSRPR